MRPNIDRQAFDRGSVEPGVDYAATYLAEKIGCFDEQLRAAVQALAPEPPPVPRDGGA
jgi:hypothetical protein